MNLLVYGSLRDPDIAAWVAGRQFLNKKQASIELKNYQAYYVEGESFPVLRISPGQSVMVDLYSGVDQSEFNILKNYEGDEYQMAQIQLEGKIYNYFEGTESLQPSKISWNLKTFQKREKASFFQKLEQWGIADHRD